MWLYFLIFPPAQLFNMAWPGFAGETRLADSAEE